MGVPMHAPSLAETTAFVAVVELKSFTKAATGFFLYYPSRRQMRPALKALVDFLRDEHDGASKRPLNR